jgi:hypothetical protein
LKLPDQNFKGDILENYIRSNSSFLSNKPLKSINKESRQIDASYSLGENLIIIECRAIWRSLGFERGDRKAVSFREKKINEALSNIDEKALWLKKNPIGKNYDISNHKRIIPVVVTPFIEFIPGMDLKYWLSDNMPRVISPRELHDIITLNDDNILKYNSVFL